LFYNCKLLLASGSSALQSQFAAAGITMHSSLVENLLLL